jgi:hypothetical protein
VLALLGDKSISGQMDKHSSSALLPIAAAVAKNYSMSRWRKTFLPIGLAKAF